MAFAKSSKIFVAGHSGLVGSAVCRRLPALGYAKILTATRSQVDLCDRSAVAKFFAAERPDAVIVAAAKVGGILANSKYPVEFLLDNVRIECNVIESAADQGCDRLLFLGSSCIYPRLAPQPLQEDSLLSGPLEKTNEAYALAKIVGLKLCDYYHSEYGRRFISAMPTNLYGPGDNFHPDHSHVIPGLLRRFHEAKASGTPSVTVWGTGKPRREFLHVDDLAEALVLLLEKYEGPGTINVGTGVDVTIEELATLVREVVGYPGEIAWDKTKPDGTPRKVLDVSKMAQLGWKSRISLKDGLTTTYAWALKTGAFGKSA